MDVDPPSLPYQQLDNEDDGEVGREEAHAALLAGHAHDGLADEGEVHEAAVGVAEGEAEELRHQGVLVLGRGAMVLKVLRIVVFFFYSLVCFGSPFVLVVTASSPSAATTTTTSQHYLRGEQSRNGHPAGTGIKH